MEIFSLTKDQKVVESLEKIFQEKNICGSFFGLGALSWVKLKVYDLDNKKYLEKELSGKLEVCNLTGVIAKLDCQTVLHPHITVCNENFEVFGGHLEEAVVAATLEVIVFESKEMTRKYDKEIGLNLLEK